MLKRPHYIAVGLVVLVTLIILDLPNKTTARLKLGIGSLFVPLFGLTGSVRHLAGQAGDTVLPRSELLRQNEIMRRENQELRLKLVEAEKTAAENERFRQLLGWQQGLEQRKRWKLKPASVVLREPANWWRTVQIDLGSRDGVQVNKPVLAPDGALVGRIGSVSLTRSQVVLLGDPNCKVSARVDNPGHDSGIILASGPLESDFVEMGYLSRNSNLKPGQEVKTTGEGGIFPRDILIGKVVDSHPAEFGLEMVARVKLAANLSALEEVWVMMEP
ncbi:MAG TPA: rod shape-determining protein MreC [Candidatus Binatia bacterium]|jgi:rod shape-determining protein MreC|nr:rod shape-determining protein MreC [Candidatus Binatia bacterium]